MEIRDKATKVVEKLANNEVDYKLIKPLLESMEVYLTDGSNFPILYNTINNLVAENVLKRNAMTLFIAEIFKNKVYMGDVLKPVRLL